MTVFRKDLQDGLEGRYRVSMAWRHESVEFLGLPYLKEERPLTLPEIYVPLSLTRTSGDKQRLYVPDALVQHRHLVVLGDPGAGKSTLIKLLAYSFGRIEPTPLARRLGAVPAHPHHLARLQRAPVAISGGYATKIMQHLAASYEVSEGKGV